MRPTLQDVFMSIAFTLSTRAACRLRQVGCVIVDKHNFIVSTGYNGKARGVANCDVQPCKDGCEGVHAEVNALLQAGNRGYCMYVTCAPCWHCMKTIINSSVRHIVYCDGSTLEPRTRSLALSAGVTLMSMGELT